MGIFGKMFLTNSVVFVFSISLLRSESRVGKMPEPWSTVVWVVSALSILAFPVLALLAIWL